MFIEVRELLLGTLSHGMIVLTDQISIVQALLVPHSNDIQNENSFNSENVWMDINTNKRIYGCRKKMWSTFLTV